MRWEEIENVLGRYIIRENGSLEFVHRFGDESDEFDWNMEQGKVEEGVYLDIHGDKEMGIDKVYRSGEEEEICVVEMSRKQYESAYELFHSIWPKEEVIKRFKPMEPGIYYELYVAGRAKEVARSQDELRDKMLSGEVDTYAIMFPDPERVHLINHMCHKFDEDYAGWKQRSCGLLIPRRLAKSIMMWFEALEEQGKD